MIFEFSDQNRNNQTKLIAERIDKNIKIIKYKNH
jgi:hypothetical protein